ncbi:hypothetical protein SNEBB_008493, partial [Seison nebaliae]
NYPANFGFELCILRMYNEINVYKDGQLSLNKNTGDKDGTLAKLINGDGKEKILFSHLSMGADGNDWCATDHRGNVFYFDLSSLRYRFLFRVRSVPTSILWNDRLKDVIIGTVDTKCFVYHIDGKLIATLKGHSTPIDFINLEDFYFTSNQSSNVTTTIVTNDTYKITDDDDDEDGDDLREKLFSQRIVTCSSDVAIIWKNETYERLRRLNLLSTHNMGLIQVMFIHQQPLLLTAFQDNTIFCWNSKSFQYLFQLRVPQNVSCHFTAFSCRKDGKFIIGYGKSNLLFIWNVETRRLIQIVELPKSIDFVKSVKYVEENFDGGTNRIVSILSDNGMLKFISLTDCREMFEIPKKITMNMKETKKFVISSSNQFLIRIDINGVINVHDLRRIFPDFNHAPPPLIRTLSTLNEKDDERKLSRNKKTIEIDKTSDCDDGDDGRSIYSLFSNFTNKHHENNNKSSRQVMRRLPIIDSDSIANDTIENGKRKLPHNLSYEKLRRLLNVHYEYPSKYRAFIWRTLLRLPNNIESFQSLTEKGLTRNSLNFIENYPIKSKKLVKLMEKMLSSLEHWSFVFGEMKDLPVMIFPFVQMFQNNSLICFEIICTFITNWCGNWFEYFPNPPVNLLASLENSLLHLDGGLLRHFRKCGITANYFGWPLLQSLFSEVLTSDEWLQLFDSVLSYHPGFLYHIILAYLLINRTVLFNLFDVDDYVFFFHHRNSISIKQLIVTAHQVGRRLPDKLNWLKTFNPFEPLPEMTYPVFNKYPKFIVDYRQKEISRLKEEELKNEKIRKDEQSKRKELKNLIREKTTNYRQQRILDESNILQRYEITNCKMTKDKTEKKHPKELVEEKERQIGEDTSKLMLIDDHENYERMLKQFSSDLRESLKNLN